MKKHTAGPWRQSSLAPHYIISGDNPDPICALAEYSDSGEPHMIFKNADANAKLIVAAPELLEALQGIIEIGKRDMSNPKYDGYFQFAKEVVAKAKE